MMQMMRCAPPERILSVPMLTSRSRAPQVDQDGVIDLDTFNQILDLDEDDTHDFSLGMTEAYFAQASTTFTDMDAALYVPVTGQNLLVRRTDASPSPSIPRAVLRHASHPLDSHLRPPRTRP